MSSLSNPLNLHILILFSPPVPFPFVNIGCFLVETLQTSHEYLNTPLADVLYLHSDELLTDGKKSSLMKGSDWGCTCRGKKKDEKQLLHTH